MAHHPNPALPRAARTACLRQKSASRPPTEVDDLADRPWAHLIAGRGITCREFARHWARHRLGALRFHDLDVPVVVHCHGFDVSFDLMKRNGKRKYSDRYKEKIIELSRRCWLIANSEFTQDRLVAQGVPRERILVWHFGVPRLEPLGSGDAVKQILFLGRFVGFKGPTETLRAFAIARERGLLANLVMAGAGPLLPASQRLVEELGIQHFVSFRGTVDQTQAAELFQKSHVFTAHTQQDQLTNQCEAFGVAFAEAMAAGLPVVTGNHAGPSTFLTHEKNALLFTPGNIEGHAKLLQQISTDEELRSRLAWNAIRTAEHDFNLTQQHDKLLDLLSNLARGSR